MTNVCYWDFNYNRVFGEKKIFRGLELTSCVRGFSHDVALDALVERALYATGGPGGGGQPGGGFTDNVFDYWYPVYCLEGNPDENDGVMLFDDYSEAIWITNIKAAQFKRYLIHFRGTQANRGRNGLNMILNPNCETNYPGSGVVKLSNVVTAQVGGSASWISTYGTPGVYLGSNSLGCVVRGLQIGCKGNGADGVADFGSYNTVQDIDAVDYPDVDGQQRSGAAVALGATCVGSKVSRISGNALANVVRNDAGNAGGFVLSDIDGFNMRGKILKGFEAGINSVSGVYTRGPGGQSPYFAAAPAIVLPLGKGMYYCYTAGTIDQMDTGYLGEERRFQFTGGAVTIRDHSQSGLGTNDGVSAFRTQDGNNLIINSNRTLIKFKWGSDYWYVV